MSKKKILYIQDTFDGGGINVVEAAKENYLLKHGYDIYNLNVLNNRNFDGSYLYDSNIKKYYIEQSYLDSLCRWPFVGRILRFFYFRTKLIYIILKLNPQIIITTRDSLEPMSVILITFWIKRILEFHGSIYWIGTNKTSIKDKLKHNVKYRMYKLVALTKKDAELRSQTYKQEVLNIANPLYFNPTNFSTQENKRILILARFSPEKNIPALLKNWSRVEKKHPDWILDIYGDGIEKDKMINIIKTNNYHCVHIMGYIKEPLKIIHEYSMFLLPSLSEGFPMVLFECMGCGVPIIAYDCLSGPSEAITNNVDGFLVPVDDMDTFIEKINYLIESPDLRKSMSIKCRESIKRFKIETIMYKWMDMFDKI